MWMNLLRDRGHRCSTSLICKRDKKDKCRERIRCLSVCSFNNCYSLTVNIWIFRFIIGNHYQPALQIIVITTDIKLIETLIAISFEYSLVSRVKFTFCHCFECRPFWTLQMIYMDWLPVITGFTGLTSLHSTKLANKLYSSLFQAPR